MMGTHSTLHAYLKVLGLHFGMVGLAVGRTGLIDFVVCRIGFRGWVRVEVLEDLVGVEVFGDLVYVELI